jgi:nucleoporin NUP82
MFTKTASELPTFLLYETIDLGFSDIPNPSFDLFDVNHPVLVLDPVHDDILYMYHAFGVHSIDLKEMLQDLSKALLASDEENQAAVPVEATRGCIVRPIMTTSSPRFACFIRVFTAWYSYLPSVEPVTAVAVPTDSFSTSSMVVLTANQRARVVPLASRSEDPLRVSANGGLGPAKASMDDSRSTYISALVTAPFVKPEALQKSYADLVPQITAGSTTGQLTLDAATLRQLSITVERFRTHLHGVQLARQMLDGRATLQQQEFACQQAEYGKMIALLKTIQSKRQADGQRKLEVTRAKHVDMLSRTDRILKRLMLRASPELNEHETRWFEELSRMKQEVLGMDKYDDRSLSSKAELVSARLVYVLPN